MRHEVNLRPFSQVSHYLSNNLIAIRSTKHREALGLIGGEPSAGRASHGTTLLMVLERSLSLLDVIARTAK